MRSKRIFLASLAFCITLAAVSCRPVKGSAVEIGISDQSEIYEYLNASEEGLSAIDFSLDEDEDGNRSVRLKLYGLQKIALQEQTRIYDLMDFEVAPSYISVSGSGGVGLYESAIDHNIHAIENFSVSSGGGIILSSDEFSIRLNIIDNSGGKLNFSSYSNTTSSLISKGLNISPNGWAYNLSLSLSQSGNYFIQLPSWTSSSNVGNMYIYTNIYTYNPPSVLSRTALNSIFSYAPDVGNMGEFVEIPPADDVPTDSPWDYYNNDLLPYIWDEFGHDFDQYLIFPDGYEPPPEPSTLPVEYPTMPGFDFGLVEDGTLPSDTSAYVLPELPTKEIAVPVFDFNSINPAEVMAPVANGLTSIWALITQTLTEFDLFPYVGIAIFCAIVAFCMTLGR